MDAFDLADKYRNPVMILGDGLIGQMMEPVEFKRADRAGGSAREAVGDDGRRGRAPNIINSLYLKPEELEEHNWSCARSTGRWRAEVRHETYRADDDPDVLIVAYGTVARIARTAIDALREKGLKVGLFRPITLFPYPAEALVRPRPRARSTCWSPSCRWARWWRTCARPSSPAASPSTSTVACGGMVMTAEELAEQVEKLAAVPARARRP